MIEILNRQHRYPVDQRKIYALLKKLVKHYKLRNPALTLVLANNKAVRDLNRQYLNKDAPTDVLSFPIHEKVPDGGFYFGDIIISVPLARRQGTLKNHSLDREIEILAIHGFLHLLGYEHGKGMEEEEGKMQTHLLAVEHGQ